LRRRARLRKRAPRHSHLTFPSEEGEVSHASNLAFGLSGRRRGSHAPGIWLLPLLARLTSWNVSATVLLEFSAAAVPIDWVQFRFA